MSTKRKPILSIDHEGMQRVSTLGVIDPETGVRYYWCPDAATDFLNELQAKPDFTPQRYCNRCESYDHELAIKPWQKRLPKRGRRSMAKVDPVDLPWIPGKPSAEVRLREYQKSRPGHPISVDACHMCLISFLDQTPAPELTTEEEQALKAEHRAARDEIARLNKAKANENNAPDLAEYILGLLERAWKRLRRATNACRDAGIEPIKPKTQSWVRDEA